MLFEFTSKPHFDFLAEFSKQFNIPILDDYLKIPESMGSGYVKKVDLSPDFRLVIHRYKFKEDFTIKRHASIGRIDLISIFFYNNEQLLDLVYDADKPVKFSQNNESAIQLTTSDMNSVIRFPANRETYFFVIGITATKLSSLLQLKNPNPFLKKIITANASFVYFDSMRPEVLRDLKKISEIHITTALSNFYYQIKVQELLYHLFDTLLKRGNPPHHIINNADVEKLLMVRTLILDDLSTPPVLSMLSETIGMSETKMKQLFKQTFGDTIYNYYQKIRMDEAAFLLKQAGYSVSEVGYQLGFSNLSHFSRTFKKRFGTTPKKYSVVG